MSDGIKVAMLGTRWRDKWAWRIANTILYLMASKKYFAFLHLLYDLGSKEAANRIMWISESDGVVTVAYKTEEKGVE